MEITNERKCAISTYFASVLHAKRHKYNIRELLHVSNAIAPHWGYLTSFEKVSILFVLEEYKRIN